MRGIKYLVFIVLAFSCRKENALDCVKANGSEITEVRQPGEFSVVRVFEKIDVLIRKGNEHKVEVKAGKNILKGISTKNENGILTIRNYNRCNFVRGYKRGITVVITLPYLVRVENEGVGNVRFEEGYSQDTLVVRAENSGDIHVNGVFNQIRTSSHGNGDIYLSGECNSLRVFTYGTNYTRCESLKVKDEIFIETVSIGHCYVNAPAGGILAFNIWRSGNIYYRGEPQFIKDYSDGSGSGKAIRVD